RRPVREREGATSTRHRVCAPRADDGWRGLCRPRKNPARAESTSGATPPRPGEIVRRVLGTPRLSVGDVPTGRPPPVRGANLLLRPALIGVSGGSHRPASIVARGHGGSQPGRHRAYITDGSANAGSVNSRTRVSPHFSITRIHARLCPRAAAATLVTAGSTMPSRTS